MNIIYKRVLLKVSGEALAGAAHTGINDELLLGVAEDIKAIRDLGVQVAVVVGGGNFWRGRTSEHMDRASADYMGMLATCINGLALKDALRRAGAEAVVQTALEIEHVAEPYHREKAVAHLESGKIVIFAAGLGSPFFSTDTTAALRAAEIGADVILMGKKVDAVYDSDPEKNPNAKRFSSLTHSQVLEMDLKVMDSTAASLCRDNGIRIHVFGLAEENGIIRVCRGEELGTIVE